MNGNRTIIAAGIAASMTLALALNNSQAQLDPKEDAPMAFAPASSAARLVILRVD